MKINTSAKIETNHIVWSQQYSFVENMQLI